MDERAHRVEQVNVLDAWQQALAEVPQTPALAGARRADLFGRFAAWYQRLHNRPRAERRRWQRQLGLSLAGIALLLAVNGAPAGAAGPAATITVDGVTCTLADAITAANTNTATGGCEAGSGADTINLQTNVTLTAVNNTTNDNNGLPVITSAITIEGNGNTISRSSATNFRILAVAGGGNLTLNSATVSGGDASNPFTGAGAGGGIFNYGTLTVQNSTLSGNSARFGGGIFNYGTLTVQNSTLSGNSATFGGGIRNNGTLTVQSNSTLSANSTRQYGSGGGIDNNATLTVQNSTLSGNSARYGGGIRNNGTLTVSNSTLSGNSAVFGGGIRNGGTLTVSNSTFSSNLATSGGGIYNYTNANLTVQNSTFSSNLATNGGGIFNYGTLTVSNSTLSGNSASFGGGIHNRANANLTVLSSIVALQTAGGDCSGALTSGGYNIESGTSCGFTGTGDLQNVSSASLALGALANNGGPTQTRALGFGSVALDHIPVGALEANGCGVTVTTDQRGLPRAAGAGAGGTACDVGAYEAQTPPLAVTLASFDAQAMMDRILLSWQTVSEIDNVGFNLYRSASPAGPDALLALVPSQAPGSTQGAAYSYEDTEVSAGQTWYYWLEDVDLNGATSLHGPVSATLQAPTAVTLDALQAQAASPGSVTSWGALVAALIAAAGVLGVRRRSRAR